MNLYSTTALLGILRSLKRPNRFLSSRYFPNLVTSDAESISIDIELHDEELAPFVAPVVAGEIVLEDGSENHTIEPAYIKIKTPLTPFKAIKRALGEQIGGGQLTAMERQQLRVMATLAKHQNRIARRMEVMASELLRTSKVTIEGKKYQRKVVDYGRNPALQIVLGAGARWNEAGADPLKNLEDWAQLVFDESGAIIEEVVMGTAAWNAFRSNEKVQKLLDIRRADGAGPVNIGPGAPVAEGAVFKGAIGSFQIFVYNSSYKDKAGNRVRTLPVNSVLGMSSSYAGVRYHGAIMDEKAGIQAMEAFVKSWYEEDPAIRVLMTQTAPILAPGRRDGNYAATVL